MSSLSCGGVGCRGVACGEAWRNNNSWDRKEMTLQEFPLLQPRAAPCAPLTGWVCLKRGPAPVGGVLLVPPLRRTHHEPRGGEGEGCYHMTDRDPERWPATLPDHFRPSPRIEKRTEPRRHPTHPDRAASGTRPYPTLARCDVTAHTHSGAANLSWNTLSPPLATRP